MGEAADARHGDIEAFGAEQLALDLEVAAVAAERAGGADDPVAGNTRIAAFAHGRPDRPRRARRPRQRRDIAVRRHAPRRNAPYRSQHTSPKLTHRAAQRLESTSIRHEVIARTDDEAARTDIECTRTDIEAARTDAEGARTDAEGDRTDAEGDRTDAEGDRTDNEDVCTVVIARTDNEGVGIVCLCPALIVQSPP